MKNQSKESIGEIVKRIKIYKRGTPEGDKQREAFEKRWENKAQAQIA